jgi:hypothetical protein
MAIWLSRIVGTPINYWKRRSYTMTMNPNCFMMPCMSQLKNYDLIKIQMNIVREKHTFLNRNQDLLIALNI